MKFNIYDVATFLWCIIGVVLLVLTNNQNIFFLFAGMGAIWQLAGTVVTDLKERE